jgi:tetratricopeptide (TPR) repeat protein
LQKAWKIRRQGVQKIPVVGLADLGMKSRGSGVKVSQPELWEEAMRHTRLLAAAVALCATITAANFVFAADGGSSPPPPPPPSGGHGGQMNQEDFLTRYRVAHALIYDKGDYASGIAVLRTLGYDDHPDVATLIGYASRKLGRYDDAKYWYEKALAVDPNHATTLSYYGMWHAEQGNLLKAKDELEKVRMVCGTECEPYKQLKAAIDGTVTY